MSPFYFRKFREQNDCQKTLKIYNSDGFENGEFPASDFFEKVDCVTEKTFFSIRIHYRDISGVEFWRICVAKEMLKL